LGVIVNYFQKLRLISRDARLCLVSWTVLGFAYFGIYLVLFNLYLLRLGYGYEFVGLINGVGMIAFALFSLPAGFLGKRLGVRRMMIVGMGLMAVGFGALPLAEFVPKAWQEGGFLGTWLLVSCSAPMFTVNSVPFMMAVTTPVERNHVFSLQGALFSLAGFAGSLMAGFLPDFFSYILVLSSDHPAPFRYSLFLSGVSLTIGVFTLMASREENIKKNQVNESKVTGPMPLSLFIVMGFIVLLRRAGEAAPNVFFNVYLETELLASTTLIGSFVAVCRLIAGIAALSMPLFVVRWGNQRVIGWGILGVALSILPLALIPHWVAAEIGFVGAMALSAIVNAAYFVYSQEIVSQRWQAVMSGVISMGGGIGGSFILIFGSSIITAHGYISFFLTAAIFTAVGGLLFLRYFRKLRGELARRSTPVMAD
jgi:MFS family permease